MRKDDRNTATVNALEAMIGASGLPQRARVMGRQMLERLAQPVRIAVLGHPAAGLSDVVNALLETEILPAHPGLPPMELAHAQQPGIAVVKGDGRQEWISAEAFLRLDPWRLAMVRFDIPHALLENLSFLVVPLEGEEPEMKAAINWAARRTDMAICCLAEAGECQSRFLRLLPTSLMDHAFLAVTGQIRMPSGPFDRERSGGFRAVHFLGSGPGQVHRLDRFRSQLLDHVDAARREDIEGALVVLDRFKAFVPDETNAPDAASAADFSDLLDLPVPDAEVDRGIEARPTAEIITYLAAQAGELATLCACSEGRDVHSPVRGVLGLCAESIHACNEIAIAEGGRVADVLSEAADLILLMQIENTPEAMSDAVALMVQLRHECEELLCA